MDDRVSNDGTGLRIHSKSGAYRIGFLIGELPEDQGRFHTLLLRAFEAGKSEGKAEVRRVLGV